jgi:hypothetical protein
MDWYKSMVYVGILTKVLHKLYRSDENCTNNYQQDRVDVLREYADYSWSLDPTHYDFEH